MIGVRCRIGRETEIEDTVVMGADTYEPRRPERRRRSRRTPAIGIGNGCVIKRAIIDKNARIGDHVEITNAKGLEHADHDAYCIRDGIVVVVKNAVIPSGTVI